MGNGFPEQLVRNRKSRPDPWESEVIRGKLLQAGLAARQAYCSPKWIQRGGPAYRIDDCRNIMRASCLSCSRDRRKAKPDITGYPPRRVARKAISARSSARHALQAVAGDVAVFPDHRAKGLRPPSRAAGRRWVRNVRRRGSRVMSRLTISPPGSSYCRACCCAC